MTNLLNAKRKYSVFCSSCLGLIVLYYVYSNRVSDPPDFIGDSLSGSHQDSGPLSEVENDIALGLISSKPPSTTAQTFLAAPTLLPAEYSTLDEGRQICKQFFTPSYLEHIATHQLPYCEAQSPSTFHCFTAPRLVVPVTAGWGPTDPLCIAQGVSFQPGQDADEFEIQCKLRDLAAERSSSEEAAEALEGFRDQPTDWGWYWGDTGVGASLDTWRFEDRGSITGCTKETSNNEWVMLMRRDRNDTHNVWHKLMEILQVSSRSDLRTPLSLLSNLASQKASMTVCSSLI